MRNFAKRSFAFEVVILEPTNFPKRSFLPSLDICFFAMPRRNRFDEEERPVRSFFSCAWWITILRKNRYLDVWWIAILRKNRYLDAWWIAILRMNRYLDTWWIAILRKNRYLDAWWITILRMNRYLDALVVIEYLLELSLTWRPRVESSHWRIYRTFVYS